MFIYRCLATLSVTLSSQPDMYACVHKLFLCTRRKKKKNSVKIQTNPSSVLFELIAAVKIGNYKRSYSSIMRIGWFCAMAKRNKIDWYWNLSLNLFIWSKIFQFIQCYSSLDSLIFPSLPLSLSFFH